jgi:hypothetical protein
MPLVSRTPSTVGVTTWSKFKTQFRPKALVRDDVCEAVLLNVNIGRNAMPPHFGGATWRTRFPSRFMNAPQGPLSLASHDPGVLKFGNVTPIRAAVP